MEQKTMMLQVNRTSTAMEHDEVQLELADERIHIRLAMTMEEYARVITGEAHVPVKIVRFFVRKELPKSEK